MHVYSRTVCLPACLACRLLCALSPKKYYLSATFKVTSGSIHYARPGTDMLAQISNIEHKVSRSQLAPLAGQCLRAFVAVNRRRFQRKQTKMSPNIEAFLIDVPRKTASLKIAGPHHCCPIRHLQLACVLATGRIKRPETRLIGPMGEQKGVLTRHFFARRFPRHLDIFRQTRPRTTNELANEDGRHRTQLAMKLTCLLSLLY